MKEVRPTENANLILSYDYEITLNGKSVIPQVEKIDIPDYTSLMEEAVIIQEEYFDGFLSLYFKQIALNLKLTPASFPSNLPFNLYVKDWFHIIFGMDDLDENQSLGLTCNWGTKDSLVNITVAGLEGNIALKCNLYTDSIKPRNLLNFEFTLQVITRPTLMKLMGGTYINFGLVGVNVTDYNDD